MIYDLLKFLFRVFVWQFVRDKHERLTRALYRVKYEKEGLSGVARDLGIPYYVLRDFVESPVKAEEQKDEDKP